MNASSGPPELLVQTLVELLGWLRSQGYDFRTITPATHARVNARPGTQQAGSLRDVFGWSRPFARSLLPATITQTLERAALLPAAPGGLLRSAVRVSTLQGRLFAHSAYPTEADDAVFFGPDTYRFARLIRAELAREALPTGGRILDLGCGAGPGGIVAALDSAAAQPQTWLTDINPQALAFAQANAIHSGCAVQCRQSDLLQAVDGGFDLVLANPPFMNDAAGRAYRHGGGRWGEALSLRIVQEVLPRLKPGGRLVLYTAAAISDGTDPLLQAFGTALEGRCAWRYCELDPDIFGEELESPAYQDVERIAAVALVAQAAADPMRLHLHPAMA